LLRSDIVISASIQENFGYSVVEAVRAGCIPLLPGRLSYPEIIPAQFHDQVLYKDYGDLFRRLSFMLSGSGQKNETFIKKLSDAMNTYSWYNIIKDYDRALEKLADLS
jgi:glycosyltransferase involved in cell wall biosynthesis